MRDSGRLGGLSAPAPRPAPLGDDTPVVVDESGDVHVYFPVEIEVRALPASAPDLEDLLERALLKLARGIDAAK